MNGFALWKIHRAVGMHFTDKNYDLFKYNGRFNRDNEYAFGKVSRRNTYEFMSSKFERPYDSVEYFVSNLIYTSSDEAFTATAWDNNKRWIREKESLTKLISDDLEKLDFEVDLHDETMPNLLKMIVSNQIIPQTAVALNEIIPFLDEWNSKVYFGFHQNVVKLSKLSRFCKYNKSRIESIILEKTSEKSS
jgi:hypothetical protein